MTDKGIAELETQFIYLPIHPKINNIPLHVGFIYNLVYITQVLMYILLSILYGEYIFIFCHCASYTDSEFSI